MGLSDQVFNSSALSGIISNVFTSGKKGHSAVVSRVLRSGKASCLISSALSAEPSERPKCNERALQSTEPSRLLADGSRAEVLGASYQVTGALGEAAEIGFE